MASEKRYDGEEERKEELSRQIEERINKIKS
jgi:hypothetical protein